MKVETVARIRALIEKSNMAVLTDYRGLSVKEVTVLRRKLREVGAEFHIVKNTLFKRAAEGLPAAELNPHLEGPSAATFTSGDVAAAAKALTDFAKEHKQVVLKAGMVDGVFYSDVQLEALSKLPSRDVLLAKIMAGLNSPASGIVGTTQSVIRQLMGTITAVAEKNAA